MRRGIAAWCVAFLFSGQTALAAGPTAQQKIDRITWSFETIAHGLSVNRKVGGWTMLAAALGAGAVSTAHWVDYGSIPETNSYDRNRAAAWGAASATAGAMFAVIGGTMLLFPNPDERWKEQVAKIPGTTPEERLAGFETHFQNRMTREKTARVTGSVILAISGTAMFVGGFFPSDPFYRGALWFLGGIYAGMSVPGFFMKGFYEREWDAYQDWVAGGDALTIAQAAARVGTRRRQGSGVQVGLMPSPGGLGAGATFRF